MENQDIRWKQRFDNFSRAINLLREPFEKDLSTLSQLEKEGIIQRFEFTFELAWKTLKDYMENDGLLLDTISPKGVLKDAYQAKYINNIAVWLKMINDRNLMSHTYNFATFEKIINSIKEEYLAVLDEFYFKLLEKRI
ncbi:nucleotidyltransferase substrate binding protein (TIGR01987 family) [Flavobacterium sp. CG_23.5]|uniref:nucleotidyltransferase substrate binding protein n=1 Tax=Flavobacterium sp. CG_23.5 TaxID=2760708 RepID=UPI001AE7A3F6|nr:nucleotidyltransferase substrate binding protein [Flavobacterium sp. CG_23.5]MBP2283671.1 nucleotidyltransferase substrate binding protein (TIGR01987 family) [Flavobacterium sp. CG_23.5]